LKGVKVTTGALAEKAQNNHFVMVLIKDLNSHLLYIMRLKIRPYIFAVVSKVPVSHYVMGHTVTFDFLHAVNDMDSYCVKHQQAHT
jgi:hypothetical protein